MVTNDVGPSRMVGKLNLEAFWTAEHVVDSVCSFVGQSCLFDHFVLDKGEFGENFHIFNDSKFGHELMHVMLVTELRNTAQPDFPDKNFSWFFAYNLGLFI